MSDFLAALIGGCFALLGGWLGIHWQYRRTAAGIALTILSEQHAIVDSDPDGAVDRFYRDLLASLMEGGNLPDPAFMRALLNNNPTETLPGYYSVVGNVGMLPPDLARRVVRQYALQNALRLSALRFIGGEVTIVPENMPAVAYSLLKEYEQMVEGRAALMRSLQLYLDSPSALKRVARRIQTWRAHGKAASNAEAKNGA